MITVLCYLSTDGYDIPKGSVMLINMWSIHFDPKYWDTPEAFLPERWLNENGQFISPSKGFILFSLGRRSCIGEAFAKLEIHMLTTMLLQRYTLEPMPGMQVSLEPRKGESVYAPNQQLVAKRRL